MTTKKLKVEINDTIKFLNNLLEEALHNPEETELDSEAIEKSLSFYRDMITEIEYREGGKKN